MAKSLFWLNFSQFLIRNFYIIRHDLLVGNYSIESQYLKFCSHKIPFSFSFDSTLFLINAISNFEKSNNVVMTIFIENFYSMGKRPLLATILKYTYILGYYICEQFILSTSILQKVVDQIISNEKKREFYDILYEYVRG